MTKKMKAPAAATAEGLRGSDLATSEILSEGTKSPAANQEPFAFHPAADLFPPLEGIEFDELVADIKANGLIEPVVVHEEMILDGRNRYRACLAAGVPVTTVEPEIKDLTAYVISANWRRRHLTREQKREVIAKAIKAQKKSDRQIANQFRVDHKTVGAIRKAMEATGEVSPVEKRVGKDGKARKQPARRISAAAREQEARDRGRAENSDPAPEGDESPIAPGGLRNLIKFVNTAKGQAGRWPKIIKDFGSKRRFDDEEWGELRKTLELLGRHVNAALSAIDAAVARHGTAAPADHAGDMPGTAGADDTRRFSGVYAVQASPGILSFGEPAFIEPPPHRKEFPIVGYFLERGPQNYAVLRADPKRYRTMGDALEAVAAVRYRTKGDALEAVAAAAAEKPPRAARADPASDMPGGIAGNDVDPEQAAAERRKQEFAEFDGAPARGEAVALSNLPNLRKTDTSTPLGPPLNRQLSRETAIASDWRLAGNGAEMPDIPDFLRRCL